MTVDFDTLVNGPCVATFGETVTYQPISGGPSFQIEGIFDAAWTEVDIKVSRHGQPVSTTKPCFGTQLSLFPPPAFPGGVLPSQGDTFTRASGDQYTVADVRPDGFGYVYLILN